LYARLVKAVITALVVLALLLNANITILRLTYAHPPAQTHAPRAVMVPVCLSNALQDRAVLQVPALVPTTQKHVEVFVVTIQWVAMAKTPAVVAHALTLVVQERPVVWILFAIVKIADHAP